MLNFLEQLVISLWTFLRGQRKPKERNGVGLGYLVREEEVTRDVVRLSDVQRTMHVAILGKTGSGKSSLLRLMAEQDIEAGRGFLYFDLHGDATEFLLRTIALREMEVQKELHERVVVIAPGDPEFSVGLNPLEQGQPNFVRIAEFTQLLMQRWGLERFGARTDELLRNSLYVLSANDLTLLELVPLLTNVGFRAVCLKRTPNAEVRQYFESRYNKVSEAMQATMREPILNRTSAFTADPSFRSIVGQQHSTFSMTEAMDDGHWIIADLPKGKLGEQSLTLGSLLFTIAKQSLFMRRRRNLFTIYVDEVQNYLAYESGIETVLSEARKFGVSVVTANQFLGQYSDEVRAAILSVGTQVFFQLSPVDAGHVAQALDGGKSLAERLKNLPQRHFVMKRGADRWREGCVPTIASSRVSSASLLDRARNYHGRSLAAIEDEIATRQKTATQTKKEVRDVWE